jgi:endonuclease I
MHRKIFTILWLCILAGKAFSQTALPTSWNFSTPPITAPPNGWTLGLGTNGNLNYNFGVSDNISCRFDATGEFAMVHFSDSPGRLSYYLSPQNAGNPWGGQFDIQESPNGTQWTTVRSITSKPSTSTSFTGGKYIDNLNQSSRYVRFFFTLKLPGLAPPNPPGGNMALDSILIQSAPAGQNASIAIRRNGNVVVNGSTFVFGNSTSIPFQVQNAGTQQALSIDSVRFEGPAASDFSAPAAPTSIPANSNQDLTVNFSPSSNGSRICTMKVYNNDPTKNPYIIRLYGIGGTVASEPLEAPGAISFSNVNTFSFRMAFSNPSQKPERYLILRKRNSPITESPNDGTTYRKGDQIGQAQVAYVGDSALSFFRPNFIFANSTYHFKVFSFNGPAGFENYLTSSAAENNVQTPGKQIGNYYDGINPLSPSFVTELRNKINPHDTVFYSLYAARVVSNWLARDTTADRQVVNCVYTDQRYIYQGAFNWWSGTPGNTATLTREHTFAQSWMPTSNVPTWPRNSANQEYPEFNDLHNLFPAHQQNGNNRRSYYPFGNVQNVTYVDPTTGLGKLGTNSIGQLIYEPKPEQKGDAARALMYMSTCYHLISGLNWSFPNNLTISNETITQSPAVILQWHQQDPPSDFEIARHELVYFWQDNRNPFIDFPEWAERINFSNMTYITSTSKAEFRNQVYTYPNPVVDKLFVDATLIFDSETMYQFFDLSGKLISEGSISDPQTFIEMPSKSGMYQLKISNERGQFVTRVIRQ